MPEPGEKIGPYRLLSHLGAGAMGEVWRARDERLDRYVALKLLPARLADDPDRRARLLREAKAAAAVPHANVVTLFDIVSDEGRDVLVMELVEGSTLSEHLRANGAMPVDAAIDCVVAIAQALSAAHERNILHRDIKAANMMITPDGQVKVLDFGLAKLREASAAPPARDPARKRSVSADSVALDATMPSANADTLATQAGSLLGTPLYMAPEQLGGDPPDERSEVFSVGVIAYEVLAGSPPYTATALDELFVEIDTKTPPPLPNSVPPRLAAAVMRCLAKRPDDRFDSMALLAAELEAIRADRATPRRRRWTWAVAGGGVAALAAAITVYTLTRPPPATKKRPGDVYVERALEEYNVFFNAKALSSLRAAITHDPDHPRAHAYVILFGHARAREVERAASEAARLLEAGGLEDRDRALVQTAVTLHDRGPSAAREALEAASVERDSELGFWSAELAYRARNYAAADREFRALLDAGIEVFRGRIYDHFSSVLLYFDKTDQAVAIGKQYRDAFPGEADAVGVYATTLAAAGRFDDALARANEAMELNEGEDTLAGLAKIHAWRGELGRARELYERSMHRAGDARRPIRRAALGLLWLMDGDRAAAGKAVSACLPGGSDSAIETRGACLWVAGLVWPERIDELVAELEKLAARGTTLRPAYGFPANLARLLRARKLFDGAECLGFPGRQDRGSQSPQHNGDATPSSTDSAKLIQARRLLEGARDFYASYHVPFFDSYRLCVQAATLRLGGEPKQAVERLRPTVTRTRGRPILSLELARALLASAANAETKQVLDALAKELPGLETGSGLRRQMEELRGRAKRFIPHPAPLISSAR